jgi:hypothetical protein
MSTVGAGPKHMHAAVHDQTHTQGNAQQLCAWTYNAWRLSQRTEMRVPLALYSHPRCRRQCTVAQGLRVQSLRVHVRLHTHHPHPRRPTEGASGCGKHVRIQCCHHNSHPLWQSLQGLSIQLLSSGRCATGPSHICGVCDNRCCTLRVFSPSLPLPTCLHPHSPAIKPHRGLSKTGRKDSTALMLHWLGPHESVSRGGRAE